MEYDLNTLLADNICYIGTKYHESMVRTIHAAHYCSVFLEKIHVSLCHWVTSLACIITTLYSRPTFNTSPYPYSPTSQFNKKYVCLLTCLFLPSWPQNALVHRSQKKLSLAVQVPVALSVRNPPPEQVRQLVFT